MDEHVTLPDADAVVGATAGPSPVASLKAKVDQHPYGALAAALGVGYALGGGIFTPLTSRLVRFGLRVGLRAALLPIVTAQISEFVEGVVRREKERVDGGASSAPTASPAAKA
jgi:hypothetical protein